MTLQIAFELNGTVPPASAAHDPSNTTPGPSPRRVDILHSCCRLSRLPNHGRGGRRSTPEANPSNLSWIRILSGPKDIRNPPYRWWSKRPVLKHLQRTTGGAPRCARRCPEAHIEESGAEGAEKGWPMAKKGLTILCMIFPLFWIVSNSTFIGLKELFIW